MNITSILVPYEEYVELKRTKEKQDSFGPDYKTLLEKYSVLQERHESLEQKYNAIQSDYYTLQKEYEYLKKVMTEVQKTNNKLQEQIKSKKPTRENNTPIIKKEETPVVKEEKENKSNPEKERFKKTLTSTMKMMKDFEEDLDW